MSKNSWHIEASSLAMNRFGAGVSASATRLTPASYSQSLTSDTERHPTVLGHTLIPGLEDTLDLNRRLYGIQGSGELREEVVSPEVHDSSVVLPHQQIDLFAVGAQRSDGGVLILRQA